MKESRYPLSLAFLKLSVNKLLSILLICLISCAESSVSEKEDRTVIEELFGSESAGEVHGTSIGDDIEYVMKQISPHIVSEMPDEITARIPLNIKDSTFFDIDYDFKEGKLYSIDLDIYPKDMADCLLLFSEFKLYYDQAYGKGSQDEGYVVWYTKTKSGDDVEISMIDESKLRNKPYLAISFYQEDGIAD